MKPSTQTSFAERTGRTLGRVWRGFARLDREACGWLAVQGLPVALAKTVLWVIKLAVLGALLYIAFWLALVLLFAVVSAWVARNAAFDDQEAEWRMGLSGYGLYRGDIRIDPGSPDDD